MTALVALLAAILVGSADFLLGVAARDSNPFSVPLISQTCGLLTLVISVIVVDNSGVLFEDMAWGAAAGTVSAAGYIVFLAAIRLGQMSLVAPIAAATGAIIPAIYDLVFSQTPNISTSIGIVIAITAIIFVSLQEPEVSEKSFQATLLALTSGCLFGVFFLSLSFTSTDAGIWPLVASRVVSIPLLIVVNLFATRGIHFSRSALKGTAIAGTIEMIASVLILWALRRGPVAVAGVFGSLYPTSTILLAWFILGERLRNIQKFGVVLALAAIAITAL